MEHRYGEEAQGEGGKEEQEEETVGRF